MTPNKTYTVTNLPASVSIGRQTETGVFDLRIDCTPWLALWPELELSIWVTPPGGAAAYPADTHLEGSVLVWDVNTGDTAVEGKGTLEVMGLADGLKKLSAIVTTEVLRTTTEVTAEPPEPAQAWVDKVLNAASTAAKEAAEIAATEAAEQAAQNVLESIPDEYEDLSELANETADSLEIVNGVKRIDFEAGYFNLTAEGTTVDITSRAASSAGMVSGVAECAPGDIISVNIQGAGAASGGARAYAFLDTDGVVLRRSDRNLLLEKTTLTAPEGAAYVVLNTQSSGLDYYAFVGVLTKDLTAEIKNCMRIAMPTVTLLSVTNDVDGLFTPGVYKVTTTSMAGQIANLPDTRGGLFYVVGGTQSDYVRQFYITNNHESYTYVRYYAAATHGWGKWFKYATSYDLQNYVTRAELNAQRGQSCTWLSFLRYIGHLFIDTIAQDAEPVIPSESVYEVEFSKRLGFRIVEGHIQPTATPGKYVVMHGVSGTLGYELVKVSDGTFDADTRIDSLTFDEIRANYKYRSKYAKYQTAVASAEEWLLACKTHGIVPMVRCDDPEAVDLVREYVGDDFILYNGTREQHKGVLMHYQNQLGETLEEAKARVDTMVTTYGLPLVICTFALDYLTQDEMKDLVRHAHSKGALFMTANCYYNAALWRIPKAANAGVDLYSSAWEVEPFDNGNLCNYHADVDFSDFVTTGSTANGVLTLAEGDTITVDAMGPQFLAKAGLTIKYTGQIQVVMGNYWKPYTFTSDGANEQYFSTYFLEAAPGFTVTAMGATTVHSISFKASKC